jgi:hypothetical protein
VRVSAAPTTSAGYEPARTNQMATVASKFQERAMHGSELSPLAAPPVSIPCGRCRNEMRLASLDPTNQKTVYTYQCANGHQRLFSTTDPTSISGMSTVQPMAGPSPPEPSEIFSGVRNNLMPLASVAQRDWPTIYLERVLRPRVERAR